MLRRDKSYPQRQIKSAWLFCNNKRPLPTVIHDDFERLQ